ncbi:hypothetical protein HK098_007645 [Nowakowskiella sp. JEL0407]|nr:hypothetical protein HK098_007645 [Nowakowskiella sp. JEL0407]
MARKRQSRKSAASEPEEVEKDNVTPEEIIDDDSDNEMPAANLKSAVSEKALSWKDKLEKLSKLRVESRSSNKQEVIAEHRMKNENPKELIRHERKRKEAEMLLAESKAQEEGDDIMRIKAYEWSAEEVEQWEEKQKEKAARVDKGFTDYGQVAEKKYWKLTKEMKPNIQHYNSQKSKVEGNESAANNEFYRDANSLAYARPDDKPSKEVLDKVVNDLEAQLEKRSKFSRRRPYSEDGDITFINERNMRFNRKIARAFDKYTTEIKANFERGTAL